MMPTRVGPQLVPDPTVPLIDRLDPRGRNTVAMMFDRVIHQLGSFHRGDKIIALLKRSLEEPIWAEAPPDLAWSTFIGRLNDELFEDRLLAEEDSLAFWQVVFSQEPPPASPSGLRH